jgi:hypothetical protein
MVISADRKPIAFDRSPTSAAPARDAALGVWAANRSADFTRTEVGSAGAAHRWVRQGPVIA